ncbi:MAG: GH3 auxin-responsive promoter family protein [Cytophagales bacterium]|nr:GH3 auxin-responsive promoter family protein [Cytophagales bacterium]
MRKRIHQIELFTKYPHDVQDEVLRRLISTARYTEFGQKYAFDDLINYEDFKRRVPIHTYEQIFPYINRAMHGEKIRFGRLKGKWFAKSSGTTNALKVNLFPLPPKGIWKSVILKAASGLLSIYVNNNPETRIFSGKGLGVGGSLHRPTNLIPLLPPIMAMYQRWRIQNLPPWAEFIPYFQGG